MSSDNHEAVDDKQASLDSNWFQQSCYDFYWKNYIYSQNFMRTSSNDFCRRYLNNPKYNKYLEASIKANQYAYEASVEAVGKYSKNESIIMNDVDDRDDIELEFEINEELMEFYKESLKYKRDKKEEEKQRLKQIASGQTTDYVSGEQVRLNVNVSSIYTPLERVGLKREEEMMTLYGSKASQIHLMETKMQMKFDENYDKYRPVYWPSFPLRIMFN